MMKQVDGFSSGLLALDGPDFPLSVCSVSLYAGDGSSYYKAIRKALLDSISDYKIFRQRLLSVPGKLDHPYWIEDPDFDVDCHLRRLCLPRPGNWSQFYLELARLQATPIDRGRPLWEAYVIEGLKGMDGLPEGSFALVFRAHRAIVDNGQLNSLLLRLHDLEARGTVHPHAQTVVRENHPAGPELLAYALRNHTRRLLKSGRLLRGGMDRWRSSQNQGELAPVVPEVKRTVFNNRPSSFRVVRHFNMELKDCRMLMAAVEGVGLQDVCMALIGEAMHRYLKARDALPETELVATCPAGFAQRLIRLNAPETSSVVRMSLCSQERDPVQRLRLLRDESMAALAREKTWNSDLMQQGSELLPPWLLELGLWGYKSLEQRTSPLCHTRIEAVRSVDFPLYFTGAEQLTNFMLSPLVPGCGLTHTLCNQGKTLTVGINACREAMPDPDAYLKGMQQAWADMQVAVQSGISTPAGLAKRA